MGISVKSHHTQRRSTALSLVLLSDTHELHRKIDVPYGEILIHAGDFTLFSRSLRAIEDFNTWLGELPHPHKVVVPGNHEFFLEGDLSRRSLLSNATVLIKEAIEIGGLHIWGSPVTPLFGAAFGMSSAEDRRKMYAGIPESTDLVVSHGPPYGILDAAPESGFHSGCRELFDAIMRVKPKLVACGHVHGAYGIFQTDDTTFVNAALLGLHGGIDKAPIVLRMSRR